MNKAKAKKWLRTHPPPRDWRGTPLEYAELEMVDWKMVIGVGICAMAIYVLSRPKQ